jgi:Zn-dependent M28 family amino/carboxypeptidase
MAGQDFDALKKQALSREFKPVPLGLKASLAIRNTMRTLDSRNVVAKLEGSDPAHKDEYVVYTAHWDHLGVGTPVDGDAIYNGALDNASGVAQLLEIARGFTQVRPAPKRSILFLMVTAEEQGLLGSQYYSVAPIYPLTKTVANINIDGINQWGRTRDVTVIGMGASDLDDYLRDAATEQGRTLRPDPESEKGFYYRSDHFNFAKQGVPALYVDTGVEFVGKPPEYSQQKRDEYTNKDYHAPSDEVKPDWDLAGAVEDGQLLMLVGYRVANADRFPEWKPGNEFRAKREEMLKK